jgi:hypothetical protein
MVFPKLMKAHAPPCPIPDNTLSFLAIDDLPKFTDRYASGQYLARQILESASTPNSLHAERLKKNRFVHTTQSPIPLPEFNKKHMWSQKLHSP